MSSTPDIGAHGTTLSPTPAATAPRNARLSLRGPATTGLFALAAMFATGWLAIDRLPFDAGVTLVGVNFADHKIFRVAHGGGRIGKVYVSPGQHVSAGDLLATNDAGDLDVRISSLKSQSDAAQVQLEAVRREAQAFTTMLEQRLVSRAKVTALEEQVADLERNAAGVMDRIAEAEQQSQASELRAPATGIVVAMPSLVSGHHFSAGETAAEIAPAPGKVVFEGPLTPAQVRAASNGTGFKVWLPHQSWTDARPLHARLTWVAPPSPRQGSGYSAPRMAWFELEDTAAEPARASMLIAGATALVVLPDPGRSLFRMLIDPVRHLAGRPRIRTTTTG